MIRTGGALTRWTPLPDGSLRGTWAYPNGDEQGTYFRVYVPGQPLSSDEDPDWRMATIKLERTIAALSNQ